MAKPATRTFNISTSKNKRIQVGPDRTITQENEQKLLNYIKNKFELSDPIRDQFVTKLENCDKEFSGFVQLDHDDKKRQQDTKAGKGIKPWDISLPLVDVQIDEAVTLLMSILAPDSDVYGAITTLEEQEMVRGMTRTMNKHADEFKHYSELCKFVHNALRYNASAAMVDWLKVIGQKLEFAQGGGKNITRGEITSGNEVKAIDMYNFIWDVTVPFVDLPQRGEFFSIIDVDTLFRMRKAYADGDIFNVERYLTENKLNETIGTNEYWFKRRPQVNTDINDNSTGPLDFRSILSYGTENAGLQQVIEREKTYIWIDPSEFNLASKREFPNMEMQIWKIESVNMKYIVAAEPVINPYGMLPVVTSMPRDDGFGLQTRSQAELLMPFQRFSSFMFNAHQRRTRGSVYGKTFYDSRAVPENVEETEAGWIPVRLTGLHGDVDIRKSVMHVSDIPESRYTLDDIGKVNDFMQKVLPTDLLRQVADLQRATEYQAAAVVQGSNRRGHKMAKVIDDQAFSSLRYMQYYNILYFQDTIDVIMEDGTKKPVSPANLAELDLEFSISGGLRGLDKMYIIALYKELFFALIQSAPETAARVDLLGMLDYIAGLAGDKTDLKQFQIRQAFDQLTPEQKQAAFDMYQQAESQSSTPGPNPGNVAQLPGAQQ